MIWTDQRVEDLKKLYGEGLSSSQIAAELGGVTRNAVIGKVCRLGLTRPHKKTNGPKRATGPHHRVYRSPAIKQGDIVKTPPKPYVEPAPIEDGAIPVGQRCTLLELTAKTCRWPIGSPGEEGFFFCGGPTAAGYPYCSYHSRAAYQPATVRRVRRAPYIPGRIAA